MAINKLRNATTITDSDGSLYYFEFGVNAIVEIQKATGKKIDAVLKEAFPVKPEGADADLAPDFALIRTLVKGALVEPELTEEEIGYLISDVGLEPLMEVFSRPTLGKPKEGSPNPTTSS